MDKPDNTNAYNVIAVIPAAGVASRLSGISGSKEMIPIGTREDPITHHLVPKPVCLYLLEKYRTSGIGQCIIVTRKEKADIPDYFGDGERLGIDLSYLMIEQSCGTACTIDQAYHRLQHAVVALGFPDILFSPDDGFARLLKRINNSQADVVLGLFPADKPEKTDMVDIDASQQVRNIVIKPGQTDLHLTWGIAVWKPAFSEFLHEYVSAWQQQGNKAELHIGQVILAAIHQGMTVIGETISDQPYLDIGTPDDLARAVNNVKT